MTTIDNMRVQQARELSRAWRFLSKLNVLPIPVFPVACLLISTCLAAVCIILLGRDVKSWVDNVTGIESKGLGSLMVAYGIEGFVFALSSGLRVYSANVIGDGIGAKLRVALYNNILSQPLRYFERNATGNVITLIISDVNTIQLALRSVLSPLIRNIIILIGSGTMLAVTSSRLSAIALCLTSIPIVVVILLSRQHRMLSRALYDDVRLLASRTSEVISVISTVKTFAQEAF